MNNPTEGISSDDSKDLLLARSFAYINAPLLILLLPQVFAFYLAGTFDILRNFSEHLAFLSLALFLLLIQLKSCSFKNKILLRLIFFAASSAAFIPIFHLYKQQNPYPEFIDEEVVCKLKILSVNANSENDSFGSAEVLDAPERLRNLIGHKLWFNTHGGSKFKNSSFHILPTQEIECFGVLRKSEVQTSFDRYINFQGIYYKLSIFVGDVKIVKTESNTYKFFEGLNNFVQEKLSIMPLKFMENSQTSKSFRAMILGDKSLLDKELKRVFSASGTMHIFAVSGLHVAIVAGAIFLILNLLNFPWRFTPLIAIPILFLYVGICHFPTSAMRAFMMISIAWISLVLMRKPKPFSALLLSALISLFVNPLYIFDAGFLLSYAVVGAILTYALPITNYFWKYFRPYKLVAKSSMTLFKKTIKSLYSYFLGALAISYSATLAAMPISAYFFAISSPFSALYSVFFVFLSTIAVACGMFSVMLPDFLSTYFNALSFAATWLMEKAAAHSLNILPPITLEIPNFSLVLLVEFLLFASVYISLYRRRLGFLFWGFPPFCIAVLFAGVAFFNFINNS